MVRQRWLSTALFRNAARPGVIRSVLKQAYPSGTNINNDLVKLLFQPRSVQVPLKPSAASSTCSTTISPQLMEELSVPVDLIWGEQDPEPIAETSDGHKR